MIEIKIDSPVKLHYVDDFSFMIEFSESEIKNYFYAETKINGKIYKSFEELSLDYDKK